MPFEYAILQAKLCSLQACHKFSCQFLARKCTFFHQDHKILYFKLISLCLKCKLCFLVFVVVFWFWFFLFVYLWLVGFLFFVVVGFCSPVCGAEDIFILDSRACSFLPQPCCLLIPSYIPIFPLFLPV